MELHVSDVGEGPAVLLLHGWPDTHELWAPQVAALNAAGYRTIAPDLRGFGLSPKPEGVEHYDVGSLFGDLLGVLDRCGVERAHVVGHDWGGALAAVLASLAPERVSSATFVSVGHPAAFATAGWEQREKSWYMLLFQFPEVAERWLSQNDFANFREWSRHPDPEPVIARLRDPAALTASLNVYRANLPPDSFLNPPPELPPIQAPAMGIWCTGDIALTEAAMTGTEDHVAGSWRYERLEDADHWPQLSAPDRLGALLLDFLNALR
ncbi:alpha/beta fold hydrolase [Thermomonospora umbrina]|uniref:Pimeloyl-ACP methyl ester carboxylesterase n=1 Tax=Thermomonospora umbrina TaxID=111806 RepID=A0A3D9SST1_9ACTN|nr:alpha/beta fold hydrolase [Thermomonospora umbrina]REE95614.1 pimeloyl-ACP methyl ester carboxylesterase [Thermomonospora umbrina]